MAYTEAQARAIVADILRKEERELTELLEMRRSPLSDLAASLAASVTAVPTAYDLRAMPADAPLLAAEGYDRHREALPRNDAYLTRCLATLSVCDRAVLAEQLVGHLAARGIAPTADTLLGCRRLPGRCAYFRTPLSDEAFDAFASTLDAPTAVYASDMAESCDMVARGEADYCILPITTAEGRRAASIFAMARAFRLCLTAHAALYDGEDAPITYALFGCYPRGGGREPRLSLSFDELTPSACADLMCAALQMQMRVERVSTDGRCELTLAGAGPLPLLVYLCLFAPDFRTEGYDPEP